MEIEESSDDEDEIKIPKIKEIDTVLTTEELIDIINKAKKYNKDNIKVNL